MFPLDTTFDIKTLRSRIRSEWSRIYGFILYTRKDAYVIKVLKDDVFWNSLDEASGRNWPIFYIEPGQGRGYIDNVLQISNYFGIDPQKETPCFVTFIWGDDNDNKLRSFAIPIKGETKDEVFNSLSEIVSSITDAESHILKKHKSTENVFCGVEKNLKRLKFKYKVQEFADKARPFVEFFSKII